MLGKYVVRALDAGLGQQAPRADEIEGSHP